MKTPEWSLACPLKKGQAEGMRFAQDILWQPVLPWGVWSPLRTLEEKGSVVRSGTSAPALVLRALLA